MLEARTAVETIFREESGRILAALIRISGSFERAEEALQEAFVSALAAWPASGLPKNPGAWIMTAAHRKLIDALRREATRRNKAAAIAGNSPAVAGRPISKRRTSPWRMTGSSSFLRAATPRSIWKPKWR
jgi:predicted RNA polymerase sigma factor